MEAVLPTRRATVCSRSSVALWMPSVRHGKVRISGQLIDAITGAHIWADRFERDLTDDHTPVVANFLAYGIWAFLPRVGFLYMSR